MNPISYLGAHHGVLEILSPDQYENAQAYLKYIRRDHREEIYSLYNKLLADTSNPLFLDFVEAAERISGGNSPFSTVHGAQVQIALFQRACMVGMLLGLPFARALDKVLDKVEAELPKELVQLIDEAIAQAKARMKLRGESQAKAPNEPATNIPASETKH